MSHFKQVEHLGIMKLLEKYSFKQVLQEGVDDVLMEFLLIEKSQCA